MTIGLRDIKFKPVIVLLFIIICLLMADGLYRIRKKYVIKTYEQHAADGLGGSILYLQNDGTLACISGCDICKDTLINGTWQRESNLIILKFGNDTASESLIDYNDSLVDPKTGLAVYYDAALWRGL